MYAQLGDIVFDGLYGFESFVHQQESSLPEHPRIEGKPRLQKTGDALDKLEVMIQLHRDFCTPEDELAKLKQYRADGSVIPLLNGSGTFEGFWVISNYEENRLQTGPDGLIILTKVRINLVESFGDLTEIDKSKARAKAVALEENDPQQFNKFTQLQGAGIKTTASLNTTAAEMEIAGQYVNAADLNPSKVDSALPTAQKSFTRARKSLEAFESGAQFLQDHVNNYAQLVGNIGDTKAYLDLAIQACKDGDPHAAVDALKLAQGGLGTIQGGSFNLAVLAAIRRI